MAELIGEATAIVKADPRILDAINSDLDRHALRLKALRQADAQYHAQQLPGLPQADTWQCESNAPIALAKSGRKRIPALIILVAIFIRGRYESLTDAMMRDRLIDSSAFYALLQEYDLEHVCPTALARHINNLSDSTVDRIWNTQIQGYEAEKLDDFKIFMADSTSVRANSEWPKDSRMILKLLDRTIGIFDQFEGQGWCKIRWYSMRKWQQQIADLAKQIDFSCGKSNGAKKRRRLYRKLVPLASKLATRLGDEWDRVREQVERRGLSPSQHRLRSQAIDELETVMIDAVVLIPYVHVRTQVNSHEPREDHEQILSMNDREARVILKGGREPNFGYKPQLAASRQGFITAAIVADGNISDARSLIPLLHQSIQRTGIKPRMGTVDDGYSGADNWRIATGAKAFGLETMSMSGAKGRKVIGEALWNSPAYREARRLRGLMESPIFVLKHVNGMARMRRTGVSAVRREITEKILAYNAVRAVQLRKRATQRAGVDETDSPALRVCG